jgi:hypothetical protein
MGKVEFEECFSNFQCTYVFPILSYKKYVATASILSPMEILERLAALSILIASICIPK